jgi:hypothetical protein
VRKQNTATKERLLRRATPQRPCPLVHPFPSLVPKPTGSPANPYPMYDVPLVMFCSAPNGVKLLTVSYLKISKKIPAATSMPPTMLFFSRMSSG